MLRSYKYWHYGIDTINRVYSNFVYFGFKKIKLLIGDIQIIIKNTLVEKKNYIIIYSKTSIED